MPTPMTNTLFFFPGAMVAPCLSRAREESEEERRGRATPTSSIDRLLYGRCVTSLDKRYKTEFHLYNNDVSVETVQKNYFLKYFKA